MKTSLRNLLNLVIVFLFVFAWYLIFYAPQYPASVPVSSVSHALALYIEPEDGKGFLVDAINNAKREILVEVYLMSDKNVIDGLTGARQRGAAVKVILECHPFGGGDINTKTKKELLVQEVEVKCASDNFALTHEKAVIVDGETAFVLTQNLTTTSYAKNREYNIADKNKKDVDEVRNIFLSDWEEKSFVPTLTNIIESPNTARVALSGLINEAKVEIDIEMEVIDDGQITDLLIEKAKRVKVNVIIPSFKQMPSNKKDADKLMKNGVEVKTLSSPYMHAKMILIDPPSQGSGEAGRVYIGSINLTSASMDENRELGIIVSQNDVIQKVQETFLKDWEKASATQ